MEPLGYLELHFLGKHEWRLDDDPNLTADYAFDASNGYTALVAEPDAGFLLTNYPDDFAIVEPVDLPSTDDNAE